LPAVFGNLRAFLSRAAGTGPGRARTDDPRVAAAALLFRVMDADGVRDAAEEGALRAVLRDAYALNDEELQTLIAAGEQAEAEAVDMHGFTSVLMRHWEEAERREFVGLLWDIVFADGELHELEDHTLWRVSDLLGIDSRDRVEARRRAAATHARRDI
jgi:uncharacterized tellurite resistance protein B-like protein